MIDDGAPLFLQIAEQLSDDIADATLREGDRVPSSNELAAFLKINPATAAKGINVLVDRGLLEKRRGVGMFVLVGARRRVLEDRRGAFAERFIEPMLAEARRIGLDHDALLVMVRDALSTASEAPEGKKS